MPESLEDLFGKAGEEGSLEAWRVAANLGLACLLGLVVAGVYRFSCKSRAGASGLISTLILLSMLIAMVTIAIGQNAATAFTLLGTLAIVRFRTPVRDIRDTAFVIYAVAVGIAVGARNPEVALVGTAIVGVVALLISRYGPDRDVDLGSDLGRLNIRLDGEGPFDEALGAVIEQHVRTSRLLIVRATRDGGTRMVYEVDVSRTAGGALVSSVRALDAARRVDLSFGEGEDVAD